MSGERDENNRVLHMGATPCRTACTHVITGQWTALGIANVLSRVGDGTTAPEPAAAPQVDTVEMREIAAAANPGPWVRNGRRVLWSHGTMKVSLTTADGEIGRFDAEHIATFDPPTVLALLDELDTHRARHAELVALREFCGSNPYASAVTIGFRLARVLGEPA